ncbi:MAG: hypothetical protein LBH97_03515 [Treponema sp.]|jgi:hypothetical protein|nr:hypothetical protein [Treponema sp.]
MLYSVRHAAFFVIIMFIAGAALWPQAAIVLQDENDPRSFVGMKIEELIGRCGPPGSVHAVRGNEDWQDDVVFVYGEGRQCPPGDFYIFQDRVWQLGLKSAYGITVGDHKAVAALVLGGEAEDKGDYILFPLRGSGWPLILRINVNRTGFVSAIFVYRPDF